MERKREAAWKRGKEMGKKIKRKDNKYTYIYTLKFFFIRKQSKTKMPHNGNWVDTRGTNISTKFDIDALHARASELLISNDYLFII